MPGIADPPPPPPPPAFVGSLPPRIPSEATKKLNQIKIPESTTQLKALNWSKLPITKLQETVWLKVDISKVYEQLNLQEIDELFEAFKHNIPTVKEAGAQVSKQPSKEKISVIDKQRAQNCMILLKTIKMTGDEITSVLLSMDQYNQLPIDRIEQLLKLAPSEKEKERLEEQDLHWLDTADAFFFRISRIQHYSERLHALQYTKKFPVIASELRNTWKCKKFWPDVLEIESELMNLKAAASMNIGDLEKTLRDLSSGMKLILKEIEFHESIELEEGDNFLISMGKFTVTAENQLREIENSYSAMEAKFRQTRRYFGEDEYTPADEFLQVFDQFFQNFRGARSENENLRKKKEEERKRAENPRLKRTNSASVSSSFTELGELQNLLVSKKTK
ncbi:unnamed protein product [Allacma fusca]|uniref:FH2 domain-containing protein n=1 Tax=Allacma fusca TaxID=39272 RepID=A0A8J2KPT2_9HEXA|nr:unnamed protein product [Allacma fusca]